MLIAFIVTIEMERIATIATIETIKNFISD